MKMKISREIEVPSEIDGAKMELHHFDSYGKVNECGREHIRKVRKDMVRQHMEEVTANWMRGVTDPEVSDREALKVLCQMFSVDVHWAKQEAFEAMCNRLGI